MVLVIQGTVDANTTGNLSQSEISKMVEFCFKAFIHIPHEQRETLVEKLKGLSLNDGVDDEAALKAIEDIEATLTTEESQVLDTLRSRSMIREDYMGINGFALDSIDGLAPNMKRGKLGLIKAQRTSVKRSQLCSMSFLEDQAWSI